LRDVKVFSARLLFLREQKWTDALASIPEPHGFELCIRLA
jgi:hypothetical protein